MRHGLCVTPLGLTGLGAPEEDGAWVTAPGVAYPTLDVAQVLTFEGAFVCGDHGQSWYEQIEAHGDATELAYPHRYRHEADSE